MAKKKRGTVQLVDDVLVTSADLAADVTGTLPVANGGTGQSVYTNGQLLIGNTTGNTLTKSTLTAGDFISVTNGPGSITVGLTGVLGAANGGTGFSGGSLTDGEILFASTGSWSKGFLSAGSGISVTSNSGGVTVSNTGVLGPGSSTDNALARFDGTTGKLLQNGGATMDDNGKVTFITPTASVANYNMPEIASSGYATLASMTEGDFWRDHYGPFWKDNDNTSRYGTPLPRYKVKTADQTFTSTTVADSTNLSFELFRGPVSGTEHMTEFEFGIWLASSVQTTGPKFTLTWPAGVTACSWIVSGPRAANGVDAFYEGHAVASGTEVVFDQVPVANARYYYMLKGIISANALATAGNVQLRIGLDAASGTITNYQGSFVRYNRIQ